MYRLTMAGKIPARTGRKFSPMMATTHDINDWWAAALRKRYGHEKSAHKRVAEIAQCGVRTVKGWFAAEAAPNLRHLSALMAADDDLFADWAELIGRSDAAKRADALKKIDEARKALNQI